MFEKLDEVCEVLQELIGALEPREMEPEDAAAAMEKFSVVEKLGAAGKAFAAKRVAESGVWRKEGERSPAHWMAKKTGEPVGQAVSVLETARRMDHLPRTGEAYRSGSSRRSRPRR